MNTDIPNDESTQESIKFLERDFNQCFFQIRHYETIIFNIFKFTIISYVALISLAIGTYKYSIEKNIDLELLTHVLLFFSLLVGYFMISLIIRYRIYFVRIAKYINEQRCFFLQNMPLGFQNKSKMYTDFNFPKYYNLKSSHLVFIYLCSLLNSIIIGVELFSLVFIRHYEKITAAILSLIVLVVVFFSISKLVKIFLEKN